MTNGQPFRSALSRILLLPLAGLAGCGAGSAGGGASGPGDAAVPQADYWVYVGAESADRIHRVRFGPDGIEVERTTNIGRLPTEMEGPHGLVVSPDGRHLYMTTGHGVPDGHFWKFETGSDALAAEPILLGRFPATLDVTPDGDFAFVVNFNLHGAHVPSTMSVVYTPDVVEVEQIDLCTMPHGVRTHPTGSHVYTVCMMDDQLVEVDTRTFQVSRRFSLAPGAEGAIREGVAMDHGAHGMHPQGSEEVCSPTWAHPSADGGSIFVACNRADRIVEVDAGDWSLVRTIPTGRGPYNLEATSDGRLLIATLKQGNGVEFFDLSTGESLARTPTSTTVVHGVAISPDDRYAFVSVEGVGAEPGKVDVFDLVTFRRVASAEVGQQAAGIAFFRMEGRNP
jgi:DNA-binding beta-propeller fold protein YncE